MEIDVCEEESGTGSLFFFFKQKTAYEMRISDWSSDVCSSDLADLVQFARDGEQRPRDRARHVDVAQVEEVLGGASALLRGCFRQPCPLRRLLGEYAVHQLPSSKLATVTEVTAL